MAKRIDRAEIRYIGALFALTANEVPPILSSFSNMVSKPAISNLVIFVVLAWPFYFTQAEVVRSRRGIVETPWTALVSAAQRGDKSELARIAGRIGPARIGLALTHSDPATRMAALDSLPLLPSAPLLLDKLPPLILSKDKNIRDRSLHITVQLLANTSVESLSDWEVTREFTAELCKALLTVAQSPTTTTETRIVALQALMTESALCPKPDLSKFFAANEPELRRIVLMLGHPSLAQLHTAALDFDPSVAAAAGARLCQEGKPLPEPKNLWRRMASAPQTAAEDLLDILPCLAALHNPEDLAALQTLRKHSSPVIRDAATAILNPHGTSR
jgi:hypothetical protein